MPVVKICLPCYTWFCCCITYQFHVFTESFQDDDELKTTTEVLSYNAKELPIGSNVTVLCKTKIMGSYMWWQFNDKNVTEEDRFFLEMESENINKETGNTYEVSILHIVNVDLKHAGDYVCHVLKRDYIDISKIILNVTLPAKVMKHSQSVRTKLHQNIALNCEVMGYPITHVYWTKDKENATVDVKTQSLNQTMVNTTIYVNEITKKDNGTYTCHVETTIFNDSKSCEILVLDKPQVNIDFVKAIGTSQIYLNWTVNDGNEPDSLYYRVQFMTQGDSNWYYYQHRIEGGNRSYVLKDMKNNTEYTLRMIAINSEGESQHATSPPIKTLLKDIIFIPEVKVPGVSASSITISWTGPPDEYKDYIHYYQLLSQSNNESAPLETITPVKQDNLYMFSNLNPATLYNFQVAACSEYSNTCGPWSAKVNGTTMDGISGPPSNITVDCRFDNISQTGSVFVAWKAPANPHGTIMSYNVSASTLKMYFISININKRNVILQHINTQ